MYHLKRLCGTPTHTLSLTLSLSLTHTRVHTHSRTHTHTHCALARTHPLTSNRFEYWFRFINTGRPWAFMNRHLASLRSLLARKARQSQRCGDSCRCYRELQPRCEAPHTHTHTSTLSKLQWHLLLTDFDRGRKAAEWIIKPWISFKRADLIRAEEKVWLWRRGRRAAAPSGISFVLFLNFLFYLCLFVFSLPGYTRVVSSNMMGKVG